MAELSSFLHSDFKNIDQIMSLYSGGAESDVYHEMNVSFMLTLLAVHPDDMSATVYSIFTPEAQFHIPIYRTRLRRNSTSMHQHNVFEFAYVLKGHMYQLVEGKRYLYPTGSCSLINRNTLHTEEYDKDFICVFFSVAPTFIKQLNNYGNAMLFPKEENHSNNLILQFLLGNMMEEHDNKKDFLDFVPLITETEQKEMIHNIFEEIMATMLTPIYGSTYRLQYLFLRLMDTLCNPKYYNLVHVKVKSNSDSLLFARINQLLDQHSGRISNQQLSELLNYNGTYLGRIVQKYTGKNLFQYRLSFTMKKAAELLKNTDKTIAEIASELKFSNRTHFYKLFEEYYDKTPKEYREYCKIFFE